MTDTPAHTEGVFAPDKLLRRLGLWRGAPFHHKMNDRSFREYNLRAMDFSEPFVLSGWEGDPDGLQLAMMASQTRVDLENGVIEDRIVYWTHIDETDDHSADSPDSHILNIRYRRMDDVDPSDILGDILPEQIWYNGSLIFNGPQNGGKQDPHRPEHRRLITRVEDISKQVKSALAQQKPIHEIARVFSGDILSVNFSDKALGGKPYLRGLDENGWNPYERDINNYFAKTGHLEGEKIKFSLPPTADMRSSDRLQAAMGFYFNTLEPVRMTINSAAETAGGQQDGITYLTIVDYGIDEQTGRHVFTTNIMPEDVPDDADSFKPFELFRLEFSEPKPGEFVLEHANMMEGDATRFHDIKKAKALIQAAGAGNYMLSKNRDYPPWFDILARHGLDDEIDELPPPVDPEMLWMSMAGCSTQPLFDSAGAGVGSSQAFMQRMRSTDGGIDEVGALFDVTLETLQEKSEADGAQPDIMHLEEQLRRGFIAITHGHYDHATLQYFAKMVKENGEGWLRGIPVIVKDYDYWTIRKELKRMEVPERNWPYFIRYDMPEVLEQNSDIRKIDDNNYAYFHKDEAGNIRFIDQICRNGAKHTAPCDLHLLTACFIPPDPVDPRRTIHATYLVSADMSGIAPHAEKFLERGQLALADHFEELSEEELLKAAGGDPNKLYVFQMESTSTDKSGYATTSEEFKESLRIFLRAVPEGKVPVFVPFSTNHEEYQAIYEVLNEPEFLRHSVEIGANGEARATIINKKGVDLDLNLEEEAKNIPSDKVLQEVYDVALQAVDEFLKKHRTKAQERAAKPRSQKTEEEILAASVPYRVFEHIYQEAQREITAGNSKPQILFDSFLRGDTQAFENLAQQLGFPAAEKTRRMPRVVRNAIGAYRKFMRENANNTIQASEEFEMDKNLTDSDVLYWVLRSFEKHGCIHFENGRDQINQTNMYRAIMRGDQNKASMRRTRGSKSGKRYREQPDKLALIITGPIGSAEEYIATLSRLFRADSLIDYDELTRSTGYRLSADMLFPFATQTPSMGEKAQMAQDALFEIGTERRNMVAARALPKGLQIYNPGKDRAHIMNSFIRDGLNPQVRGAKGHIYLHDRGFHREGHMNYMDAHDILSASYLKAQSVELTHISGEVAKKAAQELIQKTGHRSTIKEPEDWVWRQTVQNEQGQALEDYARITPRMRLFTTTSMYNRQYGWQVDMKLHLGLHRGGNKRVDGLNVRSPADGYFKSEVNAVQADGFLKPQTSGEARARARSLIPSYAQAQKKGGKPMAPMLGAIVVQQRKAGQRGQIRPELPYTRPLEKGPQYV